MIADRKILLLFAAIGACAAVAVALVLVGTGGGSSTAQPTATTPPAHVSFLANVPQRGATLGHADAPATLTVFEDPQCPFCRDWWLNVLPSVVQQFVKTGRLKLEWRGIEVIGPNSVGGLRGAYAAARQNRLWNLVEALYERQGTENSGWITRPLLREAAQAAGVRAEPMLRTLDSASITNDLVQAAREADQARVGGTPSFFLTHGIGPAVEVPNSDASSFTNALESALG